MQGDRLASGARSATFTGPHLKIDKVQFEKDFVLLPQTAFCEKYMITEREYKFITESSEEKTNDLLREMHTQLEVIDRLTEADKEQEVSLDRECFIEPFLATFPGRVIVTRDKPSAKHERSKLAIPRHLRKEKTLLPTTGHVIKSVCFDSDGALIQDFLVNRRVLFSPMSGTAICFTGYPTWITLELSEILGIVHKEDVEIIEEELEPLT